MARKGINVEIGKRIEIALIECDKTRTDLSVYLKKSTTSVGNLINGKRNANVAELELIAKFTNKPLRYFLDVFI